MKSGTVSQQTFFHRKKNYTDEEIEQAFNDWGYRAPNPAKRMAEVMGKKPAYITAVLHRRSQLNIDRVNLAAQKKMNFRFREDYGQFMFIPSLIHPDNAEMLERLDPYLLAKQAYAETKMVEGLCHK